ncbi:MAG TPA: TIGR03067 domain-containing protein [Gemmataceae bacterium]|nr:TIGR03067 domain-containing protein [Gemmataceae bacterium]
MRLPARLAPIAVVTILSPLAAQGPPVRPLPPAGPGSDVLGTLIHDLGYEPRPLSPDVYQVTVERDRWPVHIMVSLSTDGQRVWLESKFAPVDEPDKVAPQAWKRLLEANEKIGPAHFAFDPGDKRIHLYKSFDSRGLSANRLKAEFEHFDRAVRKTQDYWRADNFKPALPAVETVSTPPRASDATPPVAPAAKEASVLPAPRLPEPPSALVSRETADVEKLMGDWSIVEIRAKGRKTPDDVVARRKPSLTFRSSRDGDVAAMKGKVVAELRTGPDTSRTVWVKADAGVIDFVDEKERVEHGIYKLEGNDLTVCFAAPGEPRPVAINAAEESRGWVIVLRKR